MRYSVIFVLAALACSAVALSSKSDLVDNRALPGFPAELSHLRQYAGYVNVDESHGRNLFYWFVESQHKPSQDPLVLWLNGGPGCSSLGGFLGEHGPFFPNYNGYSLRSNPHSWTKLANIIYLDSPAGVGFSYSETPSDYKVGDKRTADDAVVFLAKFLEEYPQYRDNAFYVSGESYGGHYVPNLAQAIVRYNKGVAPAKRINIRGFLVGNPWTVPEVDNREAAFYWWTHAINPRTTFEQISKHCNFSNVGPLLTEFDESVLAEVGQDACEAATEAAMKQMGNINIYDIYEDVCLAQGQKDGAQLMNVLRNVDGHGGAIARAAFNHIQRDDPCIDNHVQEYLRLPAVVKAIHANVTATGQWLDCSVKVDYSRKDLLTSMMPVYDDLLKNSDIRMMVYSGDVDGIVPYTGTRQWIEDMKLPTKAAWRPWRDLEGQVGGYVHEYERLSFVTCRNAGHMVPWTQPIRAYQLFKRFINEEEW